MITTAKFKNMKPSFPKALTYMINKKVYKEIVAEKT